MKREHFRLILISILFFLIPALITAVTGGNEPAIANAPDDDVFLLFDLELYASGFFGVSDLAHAGDERLFVTQLAGDIRIVNDGRLAGVRFLDIRDRVLWGEGEMGLASLVFHPDYAENGYFFVAYTNLNGDSVVSRFQVSADPGIADPNSEEILLVLPQPDIIHNIGDLVFGPDGYLYIAVGDGGPGSDLDHQGQNLQTLYGSVLRIDVDSQFPYAIPPDNPFVGDPQARNEIFMYGLRNPWRINFDSLTHDLYLSDVGEHSYEELNFVPAGSPAGKNFGWSCYEGPDVFNETQCSEMVTYTFPDYAYTHNLGCAIIAGPVYRGTLYPELQGHFLYTDFCRGTLNALWQASPGEWRIAYTTSTGFGAWNTFGTDYQGEVYMGRFGPSIYRVKMVPVTLPLKTYLPKLP